MKDPKGRFLAQKHHAIARGIEWLLTFEEWDKWWQESGHYHERGRLSHEYCMCRKNDTGSYSIDNIYCATVAQNVSDSHSNGRIPSMKPFLGRVHSKETKAKMSANSVTKLSDEEINARLDILSKYDFSVRGNLSKFSKEIGVSHTQARRFIKEYAI